MHSHGQLPTQQNSDTAARRLSDIPFTPLYRRYCLRAYASNNGDGDEEDGGNGDEEEKQSEDESE
jgi:hypothetical protein